MDIPPRVQFSFAASVTDEPAGMVNVRLELNRKAVDPVSVDFAIVEGSAVANVDYSLTSGLTSGTVTFDPGTTVQNIPIQIVQDFKEEPDETIVLVLNDAKNADLAEIRKHTITIAMNLLPRVSFTTAASSANEDTATQFAINLNTKSPGDVVVTYTVGGTAQSPGDYTGLQATGEITIKAGETSVMLDPQIVHDGIDEDNKLIDIMIINATNAVVGQFGELQHTIVDIDPPPVATITTASTSTAEGNADHVVNLTVTLNVRSEKMITIPISADAASSAGSPADFTYAANTVVIPPGQTTGTIAINVIGDLTDEADETIVTALGTPTNATLGTPSTQTLTITDDDLACFGPLGAFSICLDRGPTAAVALPSSINTDTSGLCATAQPVGWLANMQPNSCFVVGTNVTGTSTAVTGTRPLVILASDTLTIGTLLDASSGRVSGATGPGSPSAGCKAFTVSPAGSANGGGGGAGASFLSKGGNGGSGDNTNQRGGQSPAADGVPAALRAGCNGQQGGNGGNGHAAGAGGHGGGAVYLVAGVALHLNNATVNASGGGGSPGASLAGGSGGGSGGMIKLFAPAIQVNANTRIVANGGGGSGGGDNNTGGEGGNDPDPSTPATPAAGGSDGTAGADGGAGFPAVAPGINGSLGNSNEGGGAGGGGGGYLVSNLALTGAQVSAGRVDAP